MLRSLLFLIVFTVSCAAQQVVPAPVNPPPAPPPDRTPQPGAPAKPGTAATMPPDAAQRVPVGVLPNNDGSLKFLIIGDMGTGDRPQYEVAEAMINVRARWRYGNILMVGDNMYGPERPSDYARKFEQPYAALLNDGVNFRAALGNHDEREQRDYRHFNMGGKSYYTWKPREEDVRFFFLESTYPDPTQLKWMQDELSGSKERWKIAVFHHPPYSSGGRHGSNIPLRRAWEPLFVQHNVSVVFTGHEHFYERIKPQQGILYFIVGSSGKLAPGDIREGSSLTAAGFDRDQAFLAVEIDDDVMYFQAFSRVGRVVDSGTFTRRFRADEKR
ncbi:MAG: metallophosphoesterase [Vicinamibacterales bacterium]